MVGIKGNVQWMLRMYFDARVSSSPERKLALHNYTDLLERVGVSPAVIDVLSKAADDQAVYPLTRVAVLAHAIRLISCNREHELDWSTLNVHEAALIKAMFEKQR